MADPRPSVDEESAPLLRTENSQEDAVGSPPTLLQRISNIVQEPLTPLSKVLLVVCLFLLLLSSTFVGLFAGAQHRINSGHAGHNPPISTTTAVSTTTAPAPVPTEDPREKPCTSSDCIILSASILSSLDMTQDPCEDFYQYSNGGWLNAHPIPADKSSYGQFEDLALQNERIVKQILEEPAPPSLEPADVTTLTKLKDLYGACKNETQLDSIGMAPLLDVVRTVTALFNGSTSIDPPVTEDGQRPFGIVEGPGGLTAALAFLHSRGIGALFSFDVDGDSGVDPDLMTLWFGQPELGLPSKEYYKEKDIMQLYTSVLSKIFLSISEEEAKLRQQIASKPDDTTVWPPWPWPPWGGDDEGKPENKTEKAEKLAKEVVEFETDLARAGADLDVLLQDPIATYNPVPLSNLTGSLPSIQFPTYFSTFAPRSYPSRVIVTYPPFITSLAEILSTTSSSTLSGYLVARTTLSLASYLGTETKIWKAARELEEELGGLKKGVKGDREEWCVNLTQEVLGYAAGRFFVQRVGDTRKEGTKIITDIVDTFKASLDDVKWMDKKSAKAAAEKATAIRVKVGYPQSPDTESATSIARYYNLVKVKKDDFFGSLMTSNVNDQIRTWAKLGKRRDPGAWEMFAQTVNAYYNPPGNEIVFPAGIQQPPFFSKKWPSYLSYGSFGSVAAHELTHAFDSAGRLYNQQGKLEQWWTNSTSEGFEVIKNCISDQYSAYTIDDGKGGKIHVNGNLTSGENIGDSGLIQSYRAWKAQFDHSYDAGNEYILPGLNFTREQLFFISFGRTWARNMKPAAAVQRIRTDPHSPTKYRVDGTLSNIPEFAKAFNCSSGAKLNPPPEKQCRFW